ncbi:FkbM family methyltransferase [Polymorphum gilvum]|uniref:Putative methyltransferase FkbM n=1 Tax=Polymorphum gilvum (strain LMG 25793 / CGMCC 1.9160 / SL003B-26A1) TaxID=991905 RepID=F2IWE5_POLGS|nr:FkbM family methyltransferase [Polymorphum gilvum]ADZ69244.1 Putative methyltransferase FkbM [Polymorphum gilvum SL003B-26A1]
MTEATAGLDFLHTVEERRIPTFRLDDVAALDCVDLFKIDIQGYEFEVMKNARRTLADTLAVYTEVEFQSVYLGQPLFDRIFALLTEADFILQDIVNQQRLLGKNCHEAMPFLHATRLFWADAGFVKTLGGLTPDRMIRQAAVSHFVFRWFDHAFDMLSACDRAQGSGFSGQYRDLFA